MKRLVAGILSAAMCAAVTTGCGSTGTKEAAGGKVTWWVPLSGNVSAKAGSLNETPFAEALQKETGIEVEFIHPASGSESEKFNIMISSGSMPDIVEYEWVKYIGGPAQAIKEEVILSLNDIIEQQSPNLKEFYKQHPDLEKEARTEDGDLYLYPMYALDDVLRTFMGGMVRSDILEQLNLSVPETIEDWDTMLRAFKAGGVEIPLTLNLDNKYLGMHSAFLGAYHLTGSYFQENGRVKFGPYEPAFWDFVTLMTGWYRDGLLDPNFMDTDTKRRTEVMAGGSGGAAFGSAGGDFGKWIPTLQSTQPEAEFVPVPYPVMKRGERPFTGQKGAVGSGYGAAISADSKNVENAVKLLDYGYGEAGHMLYNFGVEGVSYTMEEGRPVYTDIITDPDKNGGLGIGAAMGQYQRACYSGPFIQDKEYIYQFYGMESQKRALEVWSDTDAAKYLIPTIHMTAEENKEYNKIMVDIDTYRQEILYKTIAGQLSLDQKDAYYRGMKERGIERAIEIQQEAYDRFVNR